MSARGRGRWVFGAGALAALGVYGARRAGGRMAAGPDLRVEGRPGAALVTGASSGIGETYARELAARGLDLVLVGRRRGLLEELAGELARDHGVAAEALAADLARPEDVERVAGRVAGMGRLVLLVNNAGFGSPGRWAGVDIRRQLDMIQVHDAATAYLTRAALPGMLARGRGYVVNTASMAAFIPLAGDINYTASKAYLVAFSQALAAELHGTGVHVQALCPGFTLTQFHDAVGAGVYDRAKVPRAFWMEAEQVVKESLANLGGRVIVVPGTLNQVVTALAREPVLTPLFAMAARVRKTI
jgi:short-subunit dehydrogenase